jgi:isopenicillin-N N-acyltransferase-like protein
MRQACTRRDFIKVAGCGALAGTLNREETGAAAVPKKTLPKVPDHQLTVISGKPRERGRRYGRHFKDAIHAFLNKEIHQAFLMKPSTREEMLRYAGQCLKVIKSYSSPILDELEGMAEGTGLKLEEVVLITLHEEFYHQGKLPAVDHCTALAAGPPDTRDGSTYVGQNWDWFERLYGRSSVLLWKRPEGPSVLAYSYPGLWIGAGLNSSGIGLVWTSTPSLGISGPRVGIPSYVLIAQLLYQDSLKAALEEARRARQAGWFTFVLADGKGQLVNVEGSPKELVIEQSRGHLARVYYGTRQMTRTPKGKPVPLHPQCRRMCELLRGAKGKLDRPTLQGFFGDHQSTICKHNGTLDSLLFNTTKREAYVSRGPGCSGRWKRFGFEDQKG